MCVYNVVIYFDSLNAMLFTQPNGSAFIADSSFRRLYCLRRFEHDSEDQFNFVM
jgi:hypothetical protein